MLCVGRGSWLKWKLLLAGTPTLWYARLIVVTVGGLARASQQVSQNPLAPQSGPSTLSASWIYVLVAAGRTMVESCSCIVEEA